MTGISPTVAILVTLNNYVHDVATGLLILSALWIGWTAKDLGPDPSPEVVAFFGRGYRRSVRFAIGSVLVIIATGVVRVLHFQQLEWTPALGKGLAPILVMKHVLAFTLLGLGIWAWQRIRRRLATLPGWNPRGASNQPTGHAANGAHE